METVEGKTEDNQGYKGGRGGHDAVFGDRREGGGVSAFNANNRGGSGSWNFTFA